MVTHGQWTLFAVLFEKIKKTVQQLKQFVSNIFLLNELLLRTHNSNFSRSQRPGVQTISNVQDM